MDILCALRDVQRAMTVYETDFLAAYGLTLNEGMLLCCLSTKRLKASELAETIDLTCSNCSKVIKSVEDKNYIERTLGKEDKRQMFFTLTSQGEEQLKLIQEHPISIPKVLEHVIAHYSK
ncbi:MAG: MarR family transcriptional regulator [Paludibacteraceae bacterium]|nr:MarR family transcriptional regulator [Paludibacteraceae bacterium]MBP6285135.1 MarR family transcriptional regulator [Paludibacteraceae bacterium]